MFPSNSFSDLHLKYTDKTLVIGRSSLPFGTTLYDLDDELTLEHLLFHEEQGTGARSDGDINFMGSCNTRVKAANGVDQAGAPGSLDRSFHSEVRSIRKVRGQAAGSRKLQLMPRKRIGKKDRHSKIHTAQGLRDRRIRLSVHIARKFFDLQEMLGLDKASKTIEWLLAESRDAIDELSRKNCSHSSTHSTPESPMESEIREAQEEEEEGQECGGRKKRKVCQGQITCMRRDLRDKARARARERTREKKMMEGLNLEDSEQLLEMGNPNCAVLDGGFLGQPENCRDLDNFGAREMSSLSIIEKFLGFTSLTDKPDDFYEMTGGDAFLEGNVQEFACSDSSMFMASCGGSQGNPALFSLNIPGLDQPIHPGSVLESTPNCQDQ